MNEHLKMGSMSRRRFVQSSGALLFAAQCPVGLSRKACLLYTSPSPRDATLSRMPSSA